MSALVLEAVVREAKDENGPFFDIHVTEDHFISKRRKAAKRWGAGTVIQIRIEPADEAYTHGQLRHYYGHLIAPLSEWNGEFPDEWDLRLKAMFLPEGKTSKTECNKDELASFIQQCEVYVHHAHPEAFALYDNTRA